MSAWMVLRLERQNELLQKEWGQKKENEKKKKIKFECTEKREIVQAIE